MNKYLSSKDSSDEKLISYMFKSEQKTNFNINSSKSQNFNFESTECQKSSKKNNETSKNTHTIFQKFDSKLSKNYFNINSTSYNTTNNKGHSDNSSNKINKKKLSRFPGSPLLDLEILNSWNLPKGYLLHINKYGIENSLRNKNDGFVYFGYISEDKLKNEQNLIDYEICPRDESIIDNKYIGRHFQIRFDEQNLSYYIKDLGIGFGVFIKVDKEIKIKHNLLINIGETYIIFSLDKNIIGLKIFSQDKKNEEYSFNGDEIKCIIIGRNNNSDIYIDDKMLSRIQCNICYKDKNEKGWYLKDGSLEGKCSTNCTWFYSAEDTLIYNEMVFKTNHNLFRCILKE